MRPLTTLASLLLLTTTANAGDFGEGLTNLGPSVLLENKDGRYDHWTGIGRLESRGNRRCSAVLLDTRTPDSPVHAPAYLLTSGHCTHTSLGMIANDLPIQGHVEFNYFKDTAGQRRVYPLQTLAWSSQQNIDLAVVELAVSLEQVIKDGVQPLRLAASPATPNMPVLAVGAPETTSGYTLRASACTVERLADIVEHPYVWRVNLTNRCQDLLPGASGSPLLSREDNRILGITGTTTRGSREADQCLTDAPCEVESGEGTWYADTNYASSIERLPACFANGRFDNSLPGCDMAPGFALTLQNPHYLPAAANARNNDWRLPFTTNTEYVYHKLVRNPLQCQNTEGYSTGASGQTAMITLPASLEAGIHLLCILGLDDLQAGLSAALLSNVFTLPIQVFPDGAQPPSSQLIITPLPNGKQNVAFQRSHALPHYTYKYGPPESTDCSDNSGYKHAFYNFTLSAHLLPAKLCTRVWDLAGDPSPPREDLLEVATDNG